MGSIDDGANRLCDEEEEVYMLGEADEDSNKPSFLVTFGLGASCKISGDVLMRLGS